MTRNIGTPELERQYDRDINDVRAKAVVIYGWDGTNMQPIQVVESADSPGVFGLVVLNADGSALSAGGGGGTTPTTYHYLTEDNLGLLTEDGNYLTME